MKHGISCLVMDDPGTGEAIFFCGQNKTRKIVTAEEGGAEHMQGDNRPMGANFVADWVMENL